MIFDRIMEGRSTEISSRDTLLVCDLEILSYHSIDMIHIWGFIIPFVVLVGPLRENIRICYLFFICW